MADGKIVVQAEIDAKKAQKELDSLTKKIDGMEEKLNKSAGEQSGIKAQLDAAKESAKQTETAIKSLRSEAERLRQITSGEVSASPNAYISAYSRQAEVAAQIKEQEASLQQQDKVVERLDAKYAAITDKVNEQTEALDSAKRKAGELAEQLTNTGDASERMELAAKKVSDSMNKFSSRIAGLFKRVLVFSLITRALQSLRTWLGKTIMKNEEARAAVARLKGALLTLAQPIVQIIIPAFTAFVNILAKIISMISKIISVLFGTSYSSAKAAAKALNAEENAISGVGEAAKEAEKSMAGFDEINQLSSETAASNSGGGGISSDIMPDFSETNLDWLEKTLGKSAGWVTAALLLGGIALVAIGASMGSLSLVLAGLLLIGAGITVGTETGVLQDWADTLGLNSVAEFVVLAITLGGIAIVAIGAAMGNIMMVLAGLLLIGTAVAYAKQSGLTGSWNEKLGLDKAPQYITAALLIAGIALIAIGAGLGKVLMILAGLGLLAAGVYIGTESGTLKSWAEALGLDSVFDYVVVAIQLAGIALIAIGAMRGSLALVIAGGVLLALGIAAENIGEEKLKDWWETLKLTRVQQWVSVALLLVGIGLIAIGAAMGNILMILGGAALIGLGTVVGVQNNNLKDWVTVLGLDRVAGWVTAGLLLVGLALVVFGILTANIAMVLAGAGLIGAGITVGVTSGTFSSWLDTIAKAFLDFADHIKKIFTDLWDSIKNTVNGIMETIETMVNGVIDGINSVIDTLNSIRFTIPDWVPKWGGKSFGLNIPNISWRLELPRLAEGAVIPPNREFLAVLGDQKSGTNIETPLETMVQAFRMAMNESGGGRSQTIILQLNGREFARAVYKANNDETQRVGLKLAGVKT